MYKAKSIDSFSSRGLVKVIYSPVCCDREQDAIHKAVGETIEIDGEVVKPIAFEVFAKATPLEIGEAIGVLINGRRNPSECLDGWFYGLEEGTL